MRRTVDAVLLSNLIALFGIWKAWRNLRRIRFKGRPAGKQDGQLPESERVAVFPSLGVYSFFTILTTPNVETAVYVAGYDVKLEDKKRLASIEESLRTVGDELGIRIIAVKTNVRTHPIFRRLTWRRFHGTALAAAHTLSGEIGTAVISASFPKVYFKPCGTNWRTDHLRS